MSEKANTQELREAENNVQIEGLLIEKEIRKGTGNNGNYISADLTIETGEDERHYLTMYATEKTKAGKDNPVYKNIQKVDEEFKAVGDDNVGRENADKVITTSGRIRRNEYYNDQGLQSFPEISAAFIERVKNSEEYNPRAKFEVELIVDKVIEEVDKEDNETGRAILHGYIPLYGGKIVPFKFSVHEDGAGYVLDNYEKGDTVLVFGDIINHTEKVVKKIEAAFGQDQEKVDYIFTREYLIRGGTEAYDSDDSKAYNPETIQKALAQREVDLEQEEKKFKERKDNKGKRTGFDTTSSAKKKTRIIDNDDLPF